MQDRHGIGGRLPSVGPVTDLQAPAAGHERTSAPRCCRACPITASQWTWAAQSLGEGTARGGRRPGRTGAWAARARAARCSGPGRRWRRASVHALAGVLLGAGRGQGTGLTGGPGSTVEGAPGQDATDAPPEPEAVAPVADRERGEGPVRGDARVARRCAGAATPAAPAATGASASSRRPLAPAQHRGDGTGDQRRRGERPPVRQRAVLLQGRCLAEAVVPVLAPERRRGSTGEVPRPDRGVEADAPALPAQPEVELLVLGRPLEGGLVVAADFEQRPPVEVPRYTVSTSGPPGRSGSGRGRCRGARRSPRRRPARSR